MRVLLTLLLLTAVLAGSVQAQSSGWYPREFLWGISWSVSFPTGDTKDFTSGTSFRGFSLEGRKFIKPKLSVGFYSAWNVFNEIVFDSYTSGTTTVTGNQYRYINAVPVTLNSHYYFGQHGRANFYAGLNAGGYYIERKVDIGLYSFKENHWALGLAPEIGILFPTGSFLGFLSLRYNYAFETDNEPSESYLSLNVGLGLQ